MSIKIGSNLASLNAQRRLGEASAALSTSFERLSSGQRINRASDDAAGLAISDDLKAKGRIYGQALRNGNDGISLLNIADSAVSTLSGIVIRIRELSEQSANGTYSDKQRAALDIEAQQLSKEFTRITQTTSFNGINIFGGTLGTGMRLQLGVGISESINTSIGGAVGSATFQGITPYTAEDITSYDMTFADLDSDGILDLITAGYTSSYVGQATIRKGLGNGQFGEAIQYSTEFQASSTVSVGDLNGDGILDLVTSGHDFASVSATTIRLGLGNGQFSDATQYTTESFMVANQTLGDLNGDGVLDLVSTGGDGVASQATVRLGVGDGTFGSLQRITTGMDQSRDLSLADLNGDGILDLVTAGTLGDGGMAKISLGLGNGQFGAITTYSIDMNRVNAMTIGDVNGDGRLDLIAAGYSSPYGYGINEGRVTVSLGSGNGLFGSSTRYISEATNSNDVALGDLNGDGNLDLVTTGYDFSSSKSTIRLGLGNGKFGAATQVSEQSIASMRLSLADLNSDNVLDLATATYGVSIRLAQTREGLGAMTEFSLKTRSAAKQAMGTLDTTLQNLAKQRGVIGASQSRVGIALSNIQSAKENFAAAESRIRDADIASEAANLVRNQILQQAAASVLSQANQQPQIALKLLAV